MKKINFHNFKNLARKVAKRTPVEERVLTDFINKSHQIRLDSEEKAGIKHILNTHMDNPVSGATEIRLQSQRSQRITLIKIMPILLALMLTFTGGTALAANGSLPGDLLYPVKVNFNEKVRGVLAFSSEAQANFQSEMAARRLGELQQLAASSDEEFEATIEESVLARFEIHSENALNQIERLKAEGSLEAAANASSRLEASLEAHEDLIERLSDNSESLRARLLGILERVHTRVETAAEVRADAVARVGENANAGLKIAAENSAKRAEQAIDASKRLLDTYEDRLGDRVQAQIEVEIEAAQEAYVSGKTAIEAGDYAEAFRYFQASIRASQQAKVMMRAWVSFRIDLDLDSDDLEESDSDDDEDLDVELDSDTDIDLGPGGAGVNGNAGARVRIGL
ncbi:MAG: DUF5667 domain-containing protein [Candidatus Colwellbacteria bacterium]